MTGWSRRAEEQDKRFQRWWWASASPEQKQRYREGCAREMRVLRWVWPCFFLAGLAMIVAHHLGWW